MPGKIVIPRRTMLRGLLGGGAVALGLPPLEAMFDESGEALADGTPIPKRFGFWWWGSGARLEHWLPAKQGQGWAAEGQNIPEELQPFVDKGLGDEITIVSGMDLKIQGTGHWIGKVGMRAGAADDLVNKEYYDFGGPTIDELVASHWAGQAALKDRLHVQVSLHNFENYPPNPEGEPSPQKLWDALFANSIPTAPDPTKEKRNKLRGSVLDAVAAEAKVLQGRLGAADKIRLEQHLDHIGALQKAVMAAPVACEVPLRPGDDPPYDADHEELGPKSDLMSDIIATAFACDLSRVFCFIFTGAQVDTVFWQVGAPMGHHYCTHDGGLQGHVHAGMVFTMERMAYLLDRLSSIPEGAGTVLDSCCIMGTTEVSEGQNHSTFDIPILLAGKAGGALRSGMHYRSPSGESTSNVHLTCLKALDIPVDEFGKDGAHTTEVLPALLT